VTTRRSNDDGAGLVAAGAAILGLAVLVDSGMEHYRGSFHNKAMVLPLLAAALTVGASVAGRRPARAGQFGGALADGRDDRRVPITTGARSLKLAHDAAIATGLVGVGMHAYNIGKRPGGWSWANLFQAAPIGAPVALALAGVLGRIAHRGAARDDRTLAALAAVGIAGTAAEAALLHFRGAFQNPAMVLPVTIPPLAAGLLAAAAASPRPARLRRARHWLAATTALGLAGTAFHAYGISRRMGGWYNWSQNLLAGPPLPAPPAFTGLALAGLAAVRGLGRRAP
jgi:hypothetical protein